MPVLFHWDGEEFDGAKLQHVFVALPGNGVEVQVFRQAAGRVVELDDSFLEGVVDGVREQGRVVVDGVCELFFDCLFKQFR